MGRYANRIENAVFTLGGKTYQLEKNCGEHHLHGCFSRKIYEVKYFGDTLLSTAASASSPAFVITDISSTVLSDKSMPREWAVF